MSTDHSAARARRVVSANDAQGKSFVVKDELTETRVSLPAFTVNDVWRADSLPVSHREDDTLTGEVELEPAEHGLIVRFVTFAPDSEVSEEQYGESIDTLHGQEANEGHEEAMGMHRTDAVDIVTIQNGELYCIFESREEVLLRAGDTIINRGTNHAWSNRTGEPVTVLATVLPGHP